jgi:hypothetical protein
MTVSTESLPHISLSLKKKLKKQGEILEVGYISPEKLKLSSNNCRTIDISKMEKEEFDQSVISEGVIEHVVINEDDEIVKGQIRWRSALRTGEAEIPFIRMKFNSPLDERMCSFLSDSHHHTLHEDDKRLFVMKSLSDGLTYDEISERTGIATQTLRAWGLKHTINIDVDEEATKKIAELPKKKQTTLNKIIGNDEFEGGKEEVNEAIDYVKKSNNNELQELNKLAAEGATINFAERAKKQTIKTKTLKVTLSKTLYDSLIIRSKKLKQDPNIIVENLIVDYLRLN